ncbi:uncharacterized protein [Antedon mediterranea]|uniref:uncharacterized protein n=1 Tax=Antedon mediterranea TaxID=105859 RepID=UPI003AF55E77
MIQEEQAGMELIFASHYEVENRPSFRRWWVKPGNRSSFWWDNIVIAHWDDEDWLANFRMDKGTFMYLVEELRPYIKYENTRMRAAFTLEIRLALTLYRLATGSSFRCISNQFGVGRSTACEIFHEVCREVERILMPKFIYVPEGQELLGMVENFKMKKGFPQVAGAIDGTHIKIFAPKENAQDYFNHKWSYSVLLQGLVDADGKFMNTFFGLPGSVHDARMFNLSTLSQKLAENTLFKPNPTVNIEGSDVQLLIIGDPAYPLLPNLIRPYIGRGNLDRRKSSFNFKHSSTRMTVEKAFGRLKGRWRILLKENEHEISNLRPIVQTCCILHNVCEKNNVPFMRHLYDEVYLEDPDEQLCRHPPLPSGEIVRDSITTYLED